jgi:hypothetical protein
VRIKFMWLGKLVRESTTQGNDKIARNIEPAHLAENCCPFGSYTQTRFAQRSRRHVADLPDDLPEAISSKSSSLKSVSNGWSRRRKIFSNQSTRP